MAPTMIIDHLQHTEQATDIIPRNLACAIDSATISLSSIVVSEPNSPFLATNNYAACEELCSYFTSDIVDRSVSCTPDSRMDETFLGDLVCSSNRETCLPTSRKESEIFSNSRSKIEEVSHSISTPELTKPTLLQHSVTNARDIEVTEKTNSNRRQTKSLGCGPMINNMSCTVDLYLQHDRWAKKRNELLSYFVESPSPSKKSKTPPINTTDSEQLTLLGSMMTSNTFWDDFMSMDEETKRHSLDLPPLSAGKKDLPGPYMDCLEDSSTDPAFNSFPRKSEDVYSISDSFRVAVVITESVSPYRVTYVNQAWVNLCGYSRDDIIGCTLGCIQGTETNTSKLHQLTSNLIKGIDCSVRLTNYKKSGEAFENNLRVVPLKNKNDQITNFFGTLEECF